MSKRDLLVLLEDIMLAIQKIGRYTSQMDHDAFLADELVVDGVARNLESLAKLPANYRKSSGVIMPKSRGRKSPDSGTELFTIILVWILRSFGKSSSTTCPSWRSKSALFKAKLLFHATRCLAFSS
jgi:hypothetical protein